MINDVIKKVRETRERMAQAHQNNGDNAILHRLIEKKMKEKEAVEKAQEDVIIAE